MTNCSDCGEPLSDGAKFCGKCGRPLRSSSGAIILGYSERDRVSNGRTWSRAPKRWPILIAGGFLLLAGLMWLTYRRYQAQMENERFVKNVQCRQLAQDFAKGRVADETDPVVISAFFSSKRGSCVAALERRLEGRFVLQVVDPVTGEVMWVEGCTISDECDGNSVSGIRLRARSAVDKWADRPLDHPVPH